MAGPLEYVRPGLFDEAVDRHHRSYVSAVLGLSPDNIRFWTTRMLMLIHQRWIPSTKFIFIIYSCFFTILLALSTLILFFQATRYRTSPFCAVGRGGQATS
jgi:hypothetical protein